MNNIWNVYDEDGSVQYTIPQYDEDGYQTRRLVIIPSCADGRILLVRPVSYETTKGKWFVPTITLRCQAGQEQPVEEILGQLLQRDTGLENASFQLRNRVCDTACLNALYTGIIPDMLNQLPNLCVDRGMEYSLVTLRQWCDLWREGLFDSRDFPYSQNMLYYIGKAIHDPDIYDLPAFQNA